MNVILADDDEDDIQLFGEAISTIEDVVDLEVVTDGNALLQRLNIGPVPDLVFLDLNMPLKNGFECLEEIRESKELKEIPVVIYSTSSQRKDIVDTHSMGATLYLRKPSSFDQLVKSLKGIFNINWKEYDSIVSLDKFIFPK